MSPLNADSRVPLYHQLADVLRERIRVGEYPAGDRIPSEPELSRTFGIGRPTVRQATDLLVRQRCLERRRGSGTFVIHPPDEIDALSLAGTMASFAKSGLAVTASIVEPVKRVRVGPDAENPFAGREAWTLQRLSHAEGIPALLEALWLDVELFAGLDDISLEGRSLSQLADQHFRLRAGSADQNFRVANCDAASAARLELAGGTPILLVKRRVHFPGAPNAVYSELRCRTDELVFSQTLETPQHG